MLAVSLVVAGCSDASDSASDTASSSTTSAPAEPVEAFFSQTAAGATIDGEAVTLTGVSSSVLVVDTRPDRGFARMPIAEFVDSWDDRFAGDPPNAILTAEVDGTEKSGAFVLSSPIYDPDAGTLVYSATSLAGSDGPTGRVGLASLIIDSGPAGVVPRKPTALAVGPVDNPDDGPQVELEDPRNTLVIVREPANGGLAMEVVEKAEDNYLAVRNETDETLALRFLQEGQVIRRDNLRANGAAWHEF